MNLGRQLPTAFAAALILGTGLLYGQWVNRWGLPSELERAMSHLPELPLEIGDWRGEDIPIDDDYRLQLEKAEVSGQLLRRYVHRPTGTSINVMVLCGPMGPITTHNPEACYGGNGRRLATPPQPQTLPADGDASAITYLKGDFRKQESATSDLLRILWAYSDGTGWVGPSNARLHFVGSPFITKVYVIRGMADTGESEIDTLTPEFLRDFVRQLDRVLHPDPEAGAVVASR